MTSKPSGLQVFAIVDDNEQQLLMICSSNAKAEEIIKTHPSGAYGNWMIIPLLLDDIPAWLVERNCRVWQRQ